MSDISLFKEDSMNNRDKLLKANNLHGMEIDQRITENHKYGDENALLRKEIKRLADALNVPLSAEFEAYYNEAESVKAEVKARLN